MNTFIDETAAAPRRWGARLRLIALSALSVLALAAPLASRADTVASLLGDFTINQYCGLTLAPGAAEVHLAIVFGQLPALRELHQADANGDGVTTQEERDAYVSRLAPGMAQALKLTVDGVDMPLHAQRWTTSLPKEQNGFSLRLDIDYRAPLVEAGGVRSVRFENRNYPGRIGWHEISVQPSGGLKAFDGDAHAGSLTGGLTEALQSLPANGPLDERTVQMRITSGALPDGARLLTTRGAALAVPAATTGTPVNEPGWLAAQTTRLVGLISSPSVPPHIALLALVAAIALGALHALAPGHGKAIVGAYLVGSRGTPRHAAFLGITVTVTHTLVVFVLGLATLMASRFVVAERLLPALSVVSGLLVLAMGLMLLVQRWRAAFGHWSWGGTAGLAYASGHGGHHHHDHDGAHDHHHHDHDDHAHGHHHHDHVHAHRHDEPPHGALAHSHGGRVHTHVPPSRDQVTWRGLLALGVSGGLLPCPSAMVLLLAAVALNKTLFGLALVLAFSVGLALTLTGVGMVFLYARTRLAGRLGSGRWMPWLPVASALAITVLGAVLSYGALATGPL